MHLWNIFANAIPFYSGAVGVAIGAPTRREAMRKFRKCGYPAKKWRIKTVKKLLTKV